MAPVVVKINFHLANVKLKTNL